MPATNSRRASATPPSKAFAVPFFRSLFRRQVDPAAVSSLALHGGRHVRTRDLPNRTRKGLAAMSDGKPWPPGADADAV